MKYEEAVTSLEAAIAVLDKRIKNLKEKTESPDESKKNDPFFTREKEIADIESLIPEIKEKITDTNEMKGESIKKVAEMKTQIGFGSSSNELLFRNVISHWQIFAGSSSGAGASTSTAKPISTISFKRKKEDDKKDDANDTKKVKSSENGDSSTS